MNNFYDYFEVMENASTKEIILAYENKITKYNNLVSLTETQINEIKLLKKGLYILTNKKLREKYDLKLITTNIQVADIQEDVTTFIPVADNHEEVASFDTVFNVDNSWMKSIESNESNSRKNSEPNTLGNRIFSLSDLNKKAFSTDTDIFLRKQQCGREDKK
jgi:DnaJ-class molecular chaperone